MTGMPRRIWKPLALAVAMGLSGCSGCTVPAWWTTYRGDAQRSGVDGTSVGSTTLALAWTSPRLSGSVYAQPLVFNGRVLVTTETDDVYALDERTGRVIWHASAGLPVPSGQLPCGTIYPTVGVTSTPVIDPVTDRVFLVADTWNGTSASSIAHRLLSFNLANGTRVSGFPTTVDPPGSIPANQLQRAALALAARKVVIGYGGNNGDCATYNGWLVAVPETGGTTKRTFKVEPGSTGGAIWGSGDGPAVDSAQHVWVTTGNGFGSTYGYQESVLKLDSNLTLLDHWAPSNWSQLDRSDADLGSSEPLLLPGGLVFQIGKAGVGYLLSEQLGGTGAKPLYQAQVCGKTSDASFGGAVYQSGVIYVSCSDGLRALALNRSTQRFSALSAWKVSPAAIGPPIVSAGRVWVTDWSAGTLYALDPKTGQVLVKQGTPAMAHFITPAAANGKLFLATGQTVEAYTVARPLVVGGASGAVRFGVDSMAVGQSTLLTFQLRRGHSGFEVPRLLSGMALSDILPKGLSVASPARVSGACRRAIIARAVPSTRAIELRSTSRITASSCTITVRIAATSPGLKKTKILVRRNGESIAVISSARINVLRAH